MTLDAMVRLRPTAIASVKGKLRVIFDVLTATAAERRDHNLAIWVLGERTDGLVAGAQAHFAMILRNMLATVYNRLMIWVLPGGIRG